MKEILNSYLETQPISKSPGNRQLTSPGRQKLPGPAPGPWGLRSSLGWVRHSCGGQQASFVQNPPGDGEREQLLVSGHAPHHRLKDAQHPPDHRCTLPALSELLLSSALYTGVACLPKTGHLSGPCSFRGGPITVDKDSGDSYGHPRCPHPTPSS